MVMLPGQFNNLLPLTQNPAVMMNAAYQNQNNPGMFGGSFLPGFQFGGALGSGLSSFFGQQQAFNDFERDRGLAVESSAAQLRNLLGVQIGDQVGWGPVGRATDVVGGAEDPRSRYLSTGTVMSSDFGGGTLGSPLTSTGGINPLVVEARRRLFNLLQTDAIQPQDLARQQEAANFDIGRQLSSTSRPTSTNPNESLGQLLNFAGAGPSSAQLTMQAALANRAFSQQAAQSGGNFLNQLYATAAGVV